MHKFWAGVAACALIGAAAPAPMTIADIDKLVATPFVTPASADAVTANCDASMARIATFRGQLEHDTTPATLGTFRQQDALAMLIDAINSDSQLLAEIAPDDARRDAARACQERVDAASNATSLSRPLYDRLKAIDQARLDPTARYLLTRKLASLDRAGVSRDADTRAKITAINMQISELGIKFEANIANSRLSVAATPAELAGLPADFIAAHPPRADGMVTITTDYPDYLPVMSYARDAGLRQRLYTAFLNRAFPENQAVLIDLIARRNDLARLLGRPDFATLALEDKMIGTPDHARAFLDQIAAAADMAAHRDYDRMLARLKADDATATTVPAWSTQYLQQLIKKDSYNVNPQEVRQYFAYNNVRDGMLQLTRDLFGVQIRPWKTAVWDNSVEAYEMLDAGRVIGRFYFDTHPRPGKYSHANVVPIRNGIAGRVVPIAALVTNFPTGDHKTGLMEHRDVETFLHEYGHLLHEMFAGQQRFQAANTGNVEWDFIEAPSQMLENWVWNYDTLKRFAVNAKGESIPADLVARMNRSRYFAEAFGDRRQLGLSNVSLSLYSGPPPADLSAAIAAAQDKYSLIPTVPGTHTESSFGHLNGYSAFYYTYMWSKAISTDLYTAFEKNGLRDVATATRYRQQVLAQGGAKPAATLIASFLGRPMSVDAYRARLAKGE